MTTGESAPAVTPVTAAAPADYPHGPEAAKARGCSKWIIIGGVLFVLIDAVVIGYVVLNRDTLFTQGEDYSSNNRSVSMGMMVYR